VGSVQYYRHQWNQKLISNALADAPSVDFDAALSFYSLSNEAAGAICGFVGAPPFTMTAYTMEGKTSKHCLVTSMHYVERGSERRQDHGTLSRQVGCHDWQLPVGLSSKTGILCLSYPIVRIMAPSMVAERF
jgi:hypothetical protein